VKGAAKVAWLLAAGTAGWDKRNPKYSNRLLRESRTPVGTVGHCRGGAMFRFLIVFAVASLAGGDFAYAQATAAGTTCTKITNIKQLQMISSTSKSMPLSGSYCLTQPILNAGAVSPIGDDSNPFTGQFDGAGYTIDGLTINSTGSNTGKYVGLFAYLGNGGKILNIGLTNLSVKVSGYDVGGLIGRNRGTVSNSYTTGSVNGTASDLNGIAVCGLVGWNFGTIIDSYSAATVTSPTTARASLGGVSGGNSAGGGNSGTISRSGSTGHVSGQSGAPGSGLVEIGGLVGELGDSSGAAGTIENSYATATITSTGSNTAAGGLVGAMSNSSKISQSYSTGPVNAGATSLAGGLVGFLFNGTISESFATGSVGVGDHGDAGGLVGKMNAGTISQSYAIGAVTGTNSTDAGGLVAHSLGGTIDQTYATGAVNAGPSSIVGGLVAESGAVTTSSYWDFESTGQSTSSGGGTRIDHTYQLKTQVPSGFDNTVWGVYPAGTLLPYSYGAIYPYLKWQSLFDLNSFPLHNPKANDGITAFAASIVTVVDHSGTPLDPGLNKRQRWYWKHPNSCGPSDDPMICSLITDGKHGDGIVRAYNGETGYVYNGENCPPGIGYKKDLNGTPFVLTGNKFYTGTGIGPKGCTDPNVPQDPRYLNYDGHPGFDYHASSNTTIYAPLGGILRKAKIDNVNHSASSCANKNGWDEWHSFYIMHGTMNGSTFISNGYSTWYLHVNSLLVNGGNYVNKGDKIALSGGFGPCGTPTGPKSLSPHLHFEVRRGQLELIGKDANGGPVQDQIMDPYGEAVWRPQ
jgi:Peptidase family M23/The GLUG motif